MDLRGRLAVAARRQPHTDVAVAGVLCAVTLLTTAAGHAGGRLSVTSVLLAALAAGALVARRDRPVLALLASGVAAEAYLVYYQGDHGQLVLAAPLIALASVADASSRRRALVIGVSAVTALGAVHMLVKPSSWLGADNLALAALGGVAVAAGTASRNGRAYLAEAQARARQAEADRESEAARRVTEERLRIARDLHDALGQQLALIHVQAGVAAQVLTAPPDAAPARAAPPPDSPPPASPSPGSASPRSPSPAADQGEQSREALAREALAHIRAASRTALGELRDTVGLLRQPGEAYAPTEPVAGLAGLDELLAAFRRAGLRVTEGVAGPVRPVPVAADLTAYRVIQEALTNACKHAGGATVALRLRYRPDILDVVIENERPPESKPAERQPAEPRAAATGPVDARPDEARLDGPRLDGPRLGGTGHGLVGMSERVAALGGSLRSGHRPDGGFRVTVALPLAPPPPIAPLASQPAGEGGTA
jgi:signal transduction histidine kinase